MKYDPIMCMMVDDSVKTKDAEYKMKVTSYVINKGQSGEYYGLKNKETNQVLYSAPNNWKSREGAKRWAEKKGMIYVEDSNTLDKAIRNCDANWAEAYKEMENVMNKFSMQGISASIIYDRVKELYMKHKGDPAWETAWQKFNN
mgnify:FL=1